MRFNLLTLAATFMATVANAESSIPGYGVDTLAWDVVIPDGSIVTLNGTVQEVYSQISEQYPELDLPEASAVSRRDNVRLGKRDSVTCGNWPAADKGRIQEGISYLRGLNAAPRNGPGPGNCGRVSCSYNAAIWWCNDNTVSKTLDSWNNVADGAQLIINTCASQTSTVSGQNFHNDLWNVIVRGDSC